MLNSAARDKYSRYHLVSTALCLSFVDPHARFKMIVGAVSFENAGNRQNQSFFTRCRK